MIKNIVKKYLDAYSGGPDPIFTRGISIGLLLFLIGLTISILLITGCQPDLDLKLKQELNITSQRTITGIELDEETGDLAELASKKGYGSVKKVEELQKDDGTKIISAELEKPNTFLIKTTGPQGNETFIQEVEEKDGHLIVKKITEQGTITIDLTTKQVIKVE